MLENAGFLDSRPIPIFADNISSIKLAKNPVFHARTKHIEVHYHFVREKVLEGKIDLVYIPTHQQVADIFTKALPRDSFENFRALLGVRDIECRKEISSTR